MASKKKLVERHTGNDNEDDGDRTLLAGKPDYERCDNRVTTAKYTLITFLPMSLVEQFRRFANVYFLTVGLIMFIGESTPWFDSAVTAATTLGPLAIVIGLSLLVEGSADLKRHQNDRSTNYAPCTILERADELNDGSSGGGEERRRSTIINEKKTTGGKEDAKEIGAGERDTSPIANNGKDVLVNLNMFYQSADVDETIDELAISGDREKTAGSPENIVRIAFQRVRRMDVRQGHFVLVKNREMLPADVIMLASSSEGGNAYIETSSIDGETNLKARSSPSLPENLLRNLNASVFAATNFDQENFKSGGKIETIEQATKRVTRFSALAFPGGKSVLSSPTYKSTDASSGSTRRQRRSSTVRESMRNIMSTIKQPKKRTNNFGIGKYIATLTSEQPNPHVNTFVGKLTLPPFDDNDGCTDIPLGPDNLLLRGAVLRNTEWVIGLVVFTGTDTKLVQNAFETPSKFSQLDQLMNKAVIAILFVQFICIVYLATMAVISTGDQFDNLWYAGFNRNESDPWPYLEHLSAPSWTTSPQNWMQYFMLFVTLLTNLVPLSLYVCVEMVNYVMITLVNYDLDMYDDITDTRAVARTNIVTDLGRVQYIFSDKTGTLTQNVMRFKRCSVDGMAFGAPIQMTRPAADNDDDDDDDKYKNTSSWHPLRQLLTGNLKISPPQGGLESTGGSGPIDVVETDNRLTFNSEMFLRVMALCHTVVVEKDLEQKQKPTHDDNALTAGTSVSKAVSNLCCSSAAANAVDEEAQRPSSTMGDSGMNNNSNLVQSGKRDALNPEDIFEKGGDGAPLGFAYVAESPDEGALVSAASSQYNFQVISRDSVGISLRVSSPSIFEDPKVISGLKDGSLTLRSLAADTAFGRYRSTSVSSPVPRSEFWTVLAVNKFDSDRKRMSVLFRAPPELGELTILLCKGADSHMLDKTVCPYLEENEDVPHLLLPQGSNSSIPEDEELSHVVEHGISQALGLQEHLGMFASEGLRTLVLGMKVVSDKECEEWLEVWKRAAASLNNRDEALKQAAIDMEKNLIIVGATAIEDKLQVNVPETIATLGKAGIKLWVLTGDKRETAVEIGYSTNVLTDKMHVTEVPDEGPDHVRAQIAMEFIRLIKHGKLPEYQKAVLNASDGKGGSSTEMFLFKLNKYLRSLSRVFRRVWNKIKLSLHIGWESSNQALLDIKNEEEEERHIRTMTETRRNARIRAEQIVQDYLKSSQQKSKNSENENERLPPKVFGRAQSARLLRDDLNSSGKSMASQVRNLSLASSVAQGLSDRSGLGDKENLIDEELLSLESFFPDKINKGNFDAKKRTLLERIFAVDSDVRGGHLIKHLTEEKKASLMGGEQALAPESLPPSQPASKASDNDNSRPRALVIEGAALKHLLGDAELEPIIFGVASRCDAIIACRVSPKQKALMVGLVRKNVVPEPVTLAIGDGANDVGMIQEAHVGVGISGKEGQQAVNASDFSIAQFRFLEDLVLIHGRWNFFRQSVVVLFSFYKNACLSLILLTYSSYNVYSGTTLFDSWVMAAFNFVAFCPIFFLGIFDRCLSKEYVKSNPEVFKATRDNELMTSRVLLRWLLLTVVHVLVIYFFVVPFLALGGGMTSLEEGKVGDGEGADLQSVGTLTYSVLIILLAYKVMLESKSIINGNEPALLGCRKDGSCTSRTAWTWHGVIFGSIGFYFFFIFVYSSPGREGPGTGIFFPFTDVGFHVFGREINWILLLFIPIWGVAFDAVPKVFSNMFFPCQTQIHQEIEVLNKL